MSNREYSKNIIDYVIAREYIKPELVKAKDRLAVPGWKRIEGDIENRYGSAIAERNVTSAKVNWYKEEANWPEYTKYLVKSVEARGIENIKQDISAVLYLNNNAYEVFNYSGNHEELSKALRWIDYALRIDPKYAPAMMDTKAAILYKMGRTKQALELEEKAIEMEPNPGSMKMTLQRMKNGELIWSFPSFFM
jgi:tetratricopeptide (TPR) repeat protein